MFVGCECCVSGGVLCVGERGVLPTALCRQVVFCASGRERSNRLRCVAVFDLETS